MNARRAGARSRPDPVLHVRRRSGRLVRPALDAALSRHLLPLPSPDRAHRDGRRPAPGGHHDRHRGQGPPSGDAGLGCWRSGATPRRDQPRATPRCSTPWAWSAASRRCGATRRQYLLAHQRAADVTGGLGGLSRALRMVLQSAVLAVGAYLVINQQATAGIIIAGSILASRALAPIEVVIAQWRVFVGARQSWRRLNDLLAKLPAEPPPHGPAEAGGAARRRSGQRGAAGHQASWSSRTSPSTLKAGQGLGIIGPSASGKSSLARAIVGVWTAARGKVRLDGAAARPMVVGGAGPAHRLPAAGRGAVRRHRRAEHRPAGARAGRRQGDRRGQGGRRPRNDPGPAQRLRDADGRGRRAPVGGAAPADRPGARALRRSVPGRARRAQFQPRPRGRRGPDPGHPGRARPRRHRHRDRPPAERPGRRRPDAGDARADASRRSAPRTTVLRRGPAGGAAGRRRDRISPRGLHSRGRRRDAVPCSSPRRMSAS